jgi:putative oxidoreductase
MIHAILFSKKYEDGLVTVLRFTIGIIFVWFGILKIGGYNPVFDLVNHSIAPFFAYGYGLLALGIFEFLIGVMILVNRALFFTHTLVFFHLLGTFSTFVFGWHVVFDPHFPILSLDGEFVIKNMTLAIAGLVVLVHESRRRRYPEA